MKTTPYLTTIDPEFDPRMRQAHPGIAHFAATGLLERVHAMRGHGVSSTFRFGGNAGAVEALITARGVPHAYLEPYAWKRALGLGGKTEEHSRQRAIELFPSTNSALSLKKNHNVAEALLIAYVGARVLTNTKPETPAGRAVGAP